MMKLFATFSLLLYGTSMLLAQEKTLPIYYAVDKYDLTPSHQTALEELVKTLPSTTFETLVLRGHTDTTASVTYNQWLSEQRANGVKNYLLELGVAAEKIQLDAFGERQAQSLTNLGTDRRVDVLVYYASPPPPVVEAIPSPDKDTSSTSVVDLYRLLSPPPQEFCIAPNQDTVIRCAMGTIVVIKANSFQRNGQPVNGTACITFQVKECFLKSDMLLENVNTVTEAGEILETQGMVYTNAMLGTDTLELIQDVVIMQPTDKIIEGVKVLDGRRDAHTDAVNWTLNNNSVLRNFSLAQVEHCVTYNNFVGKIGYCGDWTLQYKVGMDGDTTYSYAQRLTNCRARVGPVIICDCCFFFCWFNEAFLWIATVFDQQMREIEPTIPGCSRRLGSTIYAKRVQNGRFPKPIVFIRIRKNIFKQRARRAKKAQNTPKKTKTAEELAEEQLLKEQEDHILELTEYILEGDQKITQGLRGLNRRELAARCNELDSLFALYNVETTEGLMLALNQPLMKEFGVSTMKALLDTLPKANLGYLEVAYKNKKIAYEDYKFYVFNASKLGWKNLDVFAKIKEKDKITLRVNVVPSKTVDCKLVFKQREFVLPGKVQPRHFYFDGIPKQENAWVVAIRYDNGRPQLAMKEVRTAATAVDLEFKEYSLEELKAQLKILDFEE
jgi:hypothetical protein